MSVLVVGGHSRDIGKTSVACAIIEANRHLGWTALKITQFGHHVCTTNGGECDCAVEDPEHPFAITRQTDSAGGSDTARMLAAGAADAYWVRARIGNLEPALPALRALIAQREYVLIESNSILQFLKPDLYLSVLRYDVEDFKVSSRAYLDHADAFVVTASAESRSRWKGIDPEILRSRPLFAVRPPSYVSSELLAFVADQLELPQPVS